MYSRIILIVLALIFILQGEAARIDDDNNSDKDINDHFMRLKDIIKDKEAELKNEILKAIKKLEDTKTRTFTRTDENIKTLFEHPLLKGKTNCKGNEDMRSIKHYKQQFSIDVKSCFNFTQSLADAEILLYNGGKLLANISATVTDILATLATCELKGPLVKYLCYMTEFSVIEKDIYEISNSTSIFVDSVKKMLSTLGTELENCFFHKKISFLTQNINEIKKKLNSCE